MNKLPLSVFIKLLLGVLLMFPFNVNGAPTTEPLPLYIIERDTLQTRNFVPIINHESMIVNLGDHPLDIKVTSKIPDGKFKKGSAYPAFLQESLLPDPLFAPVEVSPIKTSYLAQPDIITKDNSTSFVWKKVSIPQKEALIVQYDNYYGKQGLYWRENGIEIHGLEINTNFKANHLDGDACELSFEFEMINKTGNDLNDLALGFFVPVRQIGEDNEDVLFNIDEICISPNIETSQVTGTDGFGKAAFGVDVVSWSDTFPKYGTMHFSVRLLGTKKTKQGTIWPMLTLRGRSQQKPIWPVTDIKADGPVKEGRFYYLSYNLVLRANQVITLSPKGVNVKEATKMLVAEEQK